MSVAAFSVLYYALLPCRIWTYQTINNIVFSNVLILQKKKEVFRLSCAALLAQTTNQILDLVVHRENA